MAAVLITAKGKAKLSLIEADTRNDEQADVQALQRLVHEIGGKRFPLVEQSNSAAVLAAVLRAGANPRREPS